MPNNPTWEDTIEEAPSWDNTQEVDTIDRGPSGQPFANADPSLLQPRLPGGITLTPSEQLGFRSFAPEGSFLHEVGSAATDLADEAAQGIYNISPAAGDFATGVTENLTPSGILNIPTKIENIARGYAGAPAVSMPFQANRPFVPIPEPKGTGILPGLGQLAARNLNALQTPEMLVTAPVASTPLGRLYFAEQMGTHLPSSVEESATQLGSNLNNTPADWINQVGQPAIEGGMAALLSSSPSGRPLMPEEKPYTIPPEVEGVAARGAEPIQQTHIEVPPSPFFNPGVREIASRALQEAQNRAVLEPGAEPALTTLRREIEPPQIKGVEGAPKEEPLGGQISFNAPAEGGAIPSARQSAIVPDSAVKWADGVIEQSKGRVNLGVDPELLSAYAVKGAKLIETGVRDFAEWSKQMVSHYGEQIKQHLQTIWDQIGEKNAVQPETAQPIRDVREQSGEVKREVSAQENSGQADAGGGEGNASKATVRAINPEDVTPPTAQGFKPQVTEKWADETVGKLDAQRWKDIYDQVANGDVALTNTAEKLGLAIRKEGPAGLAKLREAMKVKEDMLSEWKKKFDESDDPEVQNEAIKKISSSQFFSETVEAATLNDKTARYYADATHPPIEIPKSETAFDKILSVEGHKVDDAALKGATPEVEGVTPLDPASGSPLSATDSLINKLEGLKLKSENAGRLYSLPHPEAITAIGKGVWNDALDLAIGALRAGKSIAESVSAAIHHIRKSGKAFDEAKLSANLKSIIEKESQQTRAVETDQQKMRKLSERGAESPSVPENVRDAIRKDPNSFYNTQSMEKVREAVKTMTLPELEKVTPQSNIYTAAKLEQVNRLFESGQEAQGHALFDSLSKELTRLGQVINQAKLLQGIRPENVVRLMNEQLKGAGRDPLTADQASRLTDLSRDRIETGRSLERATEQWIKDPTDANAKLAERALNESNMAALEEQRFTHRMQHRTMAGLLKAILQGNLLTPISEVANIVGNVSFVPFRASTRTLAAGLDMIDSAVSGRPRTIAARPGVGSAQVVKGLIEGIKQVPDVFIKGTGDVIKGEERTGLHPLEAWTKMFAKNPEMPTVGGKVPFSDRVKLAIEGTFGVPAEAMLRGLGAGDLPFRNAARHRLVAEAAKLNKVPDSQLAMAQKFPELFFDKKTVEQIESETARDLFQRKSDTLNHLTALLGKKGSLFDLAVSFVAPYKLTPWNIIGEILSYNPLIAAAKTVIEAKGGNKRAAEMSAAKMVVGGMLTATGWWLYKNGLMAPSMDSADEQQKARVLAGEVMPPNHINLSGLKRKLSGGDPSFKAGDETVDVFRAGGLAGAMFYMTANIGRDMEKRPADDAALMSSLFRDSILEQARFGVNQSFLKGVSGALNSITSGETDNFVQAMANSVLSIPLPNTLTALSRATREYKPDMKADTLGKQVENAVRNRLGVFGADDYMTLKRGLWGEPLRETPEGKNALVYQLFDITKGHQVTDDAVPLELYRIWRKTGSAEVIPSLPQRSLTMAKSTYNLNNEQYSDYAQEVGKMRRFIVEKLVVNPAFAKLPDEAKIKILQRAYEKGSDYGRAVIFNKYQDDLEKKQKRVGFESVGAN